MHSHTYIHISICIKQRSPSETIASGKVFAPPDACSSKWTPVRIRNPPSPPDLILLQNALGKLGCHGKVFAPPHCPQLHSPLHGMGIQTILNSGGMGGAQTPTPKEQPPGGAKTFPETVVLEGSLCLIHCQNHIKSNSRSNPSILTHRLVLYLISITLLNPFIWLIWLTSHDRHMMDTRWTHDGHYDGHYDGHW